MGHNSSFLRSREGVAVLLLEHYMDGRSFEYEDLQTIKQSPTSIAIEDKYRQIKHAVEFVEYTTIDDHAYLVREVLNGIKAYGEAQDYCRKLVWFFVAISKADNDVTYEEDKYLDQMDAGSDALVSHGINEVTKFLEQLKL